MITEISAVSTFKKRTKVVYENISQCSNKIRRSESFEIKQPLHTIKLAFDL